MTDVVFGWTIFRCIILCFYLLMLPDPSSVRLINPCSRSQPQLFHLVPRPWFLVPFAAVCPSGQAVCFSGLSTALTKPSFIPPLSSLSPCSASLLCCLLTDWLTVPSIPKVALLAIDKWSHNAPPPSLHHLLPPLLYFSTSQLTLRNISLTSFHYQTPLSIHSPIHLSIHASILLSSTYLCLRCRYCSSMQHGNRCRG